MKLKSLYIKEYKNIKEQTFDFSSNTGYIALIGENGSGKSNLLEAISLIFGAILNIKTKENIGDYWIEYELDSKQYIYGTIDKDGIPFSTKEELKVPHSLISCYSGEDSRLWNLVYERYYMGFFKRAAKGKEYIPNIIYVNKYCWKIALISLMFSHNIDIVSFIKDVLKIKIENATIKFDYNNNNYDGHDAAKWLNSVKVKYGDNDIKITDLRDEGLYNSQYTSLTDDKIVFYYLYFLSLPKKNTEKHQTIEKMVNNISIKLGDINFDDLSEGEKKLILIECITKILGDKDSLILLDEPDAHTHIARKKELLNAIESFEGQTIMTTHSPEFVELINDSNNLFPIENGRLVSKEKKELIRQISNNVISYIESAFIISSKNILVTEGPNDIKHIKAAIDYFSSKDSKYQPLLKLSLIMQGGAKMVDDYYHTVLSGLENDINLIVFAFDYDSEGRDGAKMVEKLKNNKIKYCFYHNTYPIPTNSLDFYLEDFYNDSVYSEVSIPTISGKPKYYEMKKLGSLTSSVKEKIQKKMDKKELKNSDFDGFKSFLDELLTVFKL